MALPLEIFADLELAVDGEPIDVQADGRRIVVDLPSLRAGRRLLDAEPLSRNRRWGTGRVQEMLQVAGLTVDVRLEGDTIAVIGAEATPGGLARTLQLDGVELRPASAFRHAARRRPVVTVLVAGGLALALGWAVARLLRS